MRTPNTKCSIDCEAFWNIDNGIVLCKKCHYKIHGKKYEN